MIKKNDIPCNLCGGTESGFLFDARDRLHGYEGTFTYVQCKNCGLVYMNPQISEQDAGKFYPSDYAPHQVSAKPQHTDRDVLKAKLERKLPAVASVFSRLTQKSCLLDVGCGSGGFLNKIKALTGCQVYGVDVSKVAANTAKESYGLDIFTGTVLESPFPNHYFDVITAWSCLEHINNPSEVLRKLCDLLKPDGSCIISIPNFDSLNAKLFRDKWYHLDCPRHLYIYTPGTITRLLEKSGFVVTRIIHEKSSKGLLGSLQYYFYGDNCDPRYRNRIRRSSLVKVLVSPLARIAALIKKADTMIVCAGKK